MKNPASRPTASTADRVGCTPGSRGSPQIALHPDVAGAVGLHGFTHLFGSGPASGKSRGPLVLIAVRPKACPSCRPAYGPLNMPDPNPNRTPAKAAPADRDVCRANMGELSKRGR